MVRRSAAKSLLLGSALVSAACSGAGSTAPEGSGERTPSLLGHRVGPGSRGSPRPAPPLALGATCEPWGLEDQAPMVHVCPASPTGLADAPLAGVNGEFPQVRAAAVSQGYFFVAADVWSCLRGCQGHAGLFRTQGDRWETVHSSPTSLLALDGSFAYWVQAAEPGRPITLQRTDAATGETSEVAQLEGGTPAGLAFSGGFLYSLSLSGDQSTLLRLAASAAGPLFPEVLTTIDRQLGGLVANGGQLVWTEYEALVVASTAGEVAFSVPLPASTVYRKLAINAASAFVLSEQEFVLGEEEMEWRYSVCEVSLDGTGARVVGAPLRGSMCALAANDSHVFWAQADPADPEGGCRQVWGRALEGPSAPQLLACTDHSIQALEADATSVWWLAGGVGRLTVAEP